VVVFVGVVLAHRNISRAVERMDRPIITKAEIAAGLGHGLVFFQRDSAPWQERKWVDELIAEGTAYGFWEIHPNYKRRLVRQKDRGQTRPRSGRRKYERSGPWLRECSSKTFLFQLFNLGGLRVLRAGFLLRKMARDRNEYPTPLTPAFLLDLALYLARLPGAQGLTFKGFVKYVFRDDLVERLENIATEGGIENSLESVNPYAAHATFFCLPLDGLVARHGLAPMRKIERPSPLPGPVSGVLAELEKEMHELLKEIDDAAPAKGFE